jgi:arabinofuranosyltransferase
MKWTAGRVSGALALAPALMLGWFGWCHRWMAEDAFIFLRVVHNLLAGHGPVWNVDERVEVYTSPLWVLLLTVAGALLRPVCLEWIAVLLGLFFSVVGVLAAERGALLLARALGRSGPVLPLGALVVAALPPYWDFATSGLETGLTAAWLGISFWGLVHFGCRGEPGDEDRSVGNRPAEGQSSRRLAAPPGIDVPPRWLSMLAITIGLGPLVRPDLAVMSGGFLFVLLARCRPARALRIVASAMIIPTLYQLFRMGYFAALVPNTALAKEAFSTRWDQGWWYVRDFVDVYWLWVPCFALFVSWVCMLIAGWRTRHGRLVLLMLVPVVSGLLHAIYVVRMGGDFMHGRLLLPSFFTIFLPVFVVAGSRWWHAGWPALVVVPWALVCALWLRVPYAHTIGPLGIADERGVHVAYIGRRHPVTMGDYEAAFLTRDGRRLERLAREHRVLLLGGELRPDGPSPPEVKLTLAPRVMTQIVTARPLVGLLGYSAGPRVHVVDRLGLGDAVAARLRIVQRVRPGHEKWLSDAWIVARFADLAVQRPSGAPPATVVNAAGAALACPPLKDLLEAIEAPLTPARFLSNLGVAWRSRTLAIPSDPEQAAAELCLPR